jgi:hypothetical protein
VKRHKIAGLLHRLADLRERQARSELLRAQAVLRQKEVQRKQWVDAQTERERGYLEGKTSVSGAIVGMLSDCRVVGEVVLERMEVELESVKGIVEIRRDEHLVELQRAEGSSRLEESLVRRWHIGREQKLEQELEDVANSHRFLREREERSGQEVSEEDPEVGSYCLDSTLNKHEM